LLSGLQQQTTPVDTRHAGDSPIFVHLDEPNNARHATSASVSSKSVKKHCMKYAPIFQM